MQQATDLGSTRIAIETRCIDRWVEAKPFVGGEMHGVFRPAHAGYDAVATYACPGCDLKAEVLGHVRLGDMDFDIFQCPGCAQRYITNDDGVLVEFARAVTVR